MTYPPKKMEGPTAYRDPIAPYNQDYSIWSYTCPHIGHKLKRFEESLPMWERGLQLGEGGDAAVYGAYPSMARADFQLGSLLFVCRNFGNARPTCCLISNVDILS